MTDSSSSDVGDPPKSGFADTGVRYIILTVGERNPSGAGENNSGLALQKLIQDRKGTVVFYSVLPADDISKVEKVLGSAVEQNLADVILTIGGLRTAFNDEIPEDYKKTIDQREAGVITGMIFASLEETPLDKLSRALCGITNRVLINNLPGIPTSAVCGISQCNKVLVINLPGSQETATQCFEALAKAMPYAVAFMKDDTPAKVKLLNGETEEDSSLVETGMKSKVPNKLPRKVEKSALESIDEAGVYNVIERIIKLNCLKETEEIDVKDGYGRVLVMDLFSPINIPSRSEISIDGYAVRTSGGLYARNVSDEIYMPCSEVSETPLKVDECVRVLTGAPIPPGADSVLLPEEVKFLPPVTSSDNKQQLKLEPKNYQNLNRGIRAAGSIVTSGQLIVKEGKSLDSADLGRIASVGITKLCVHKKPVVAVFSTGDEVSEAACETTSNSGRVHDSNRIILISILRKNGFKVVDVGIAKDDPTCILEKFSYALNHADVVVSTGGVSGSENDYVTPVLRTDLGASIHFSSISIVPSNSTTFATIKWESITKLIFALPGDPLVALIMTILCVLPALRQIQGIIKYGPEVREVKVILPEAKQTCYILQEKPEFCPVRLSYLSNEMVVHKEDIHRISTLDHLIKDAEKQRIILLRFPTKEDNGGNAEVKEDFLASAIMLQDYL